MSETSEKKETPEKKEAEPQATRLMMFFPPMTLRIEGKISVKAMTDEDIIDTTRDDLVELSINPESKTHFKNGEKTVKLQLTKGEADVEISTGDRVETAVFRATWISGKSQLQSLMVVMPVGGVVI